MKPFRERIFNHAAFICNTATKYTKDRELAEDITQDTMLRALKFEDKFTELGTSKGDSSLRGWLMHMAMNIMRNKLNRMKRDCEKSREYLRRRETIQTETPEDAISFPEVDAELVRIIENYDRMSDADYISVLELKAEGKTHLEIAAELDIPHGTSLSRIYRLRQILQKDPRIRAIAAEYGLCTG